MTDTNANAERLRALRQALLVAARADAPAPRALTRTLSAMGLSGVGAVHAAAATGWLARIGLWPWIGGGFLAGTVAVGTWYQARPGDSPGAPAVLLARSATMASAPSAPRRSDEPPAPPARWALPESRASTQRRGGATLASATAGTSLEAEVLLLDQARRAVAAGDAAAARGLLDRHAREFSSPQLGYEARVLRIESLARAGNCAAATELGNEAARESPAGPLARRVRAAMAACGYPQR